MKHIKRGSLSHMRHVIWHACWCVLPFFLVLGIFMHASESSLDDPLEEHLKEEYLKQQANNTQAQIPKSHHPKQPTNEHTTHTDQILESNNATLPKGTQQNTPFDAYPDSAGEDSADGVIMAVEQTQDFLEVQKNFPWIRSIGLAMVSFDDGSFRSGFGVLLPDRVFLTSSQLAHNAAAYPKNILLKMRDTTAGSLICIAQLRLKAVDKTQGLALFEVSGYTDDYCNLRSQSYYHKQILNYNAYDITKSKAITTRDFYTVTTTFNVPNIHILRLQEKVANPILPIRNAQKIVFGRPFFSKNGELLGIATIPNDALQPIIVSQRDIQNFLCDIDKSGFRISDFVHKLCH